MRSYSWSQVTRVFFFSRPSCVIWHIPSKKDVRFYFYVSAFSKQIFLIVLQFICHFAPQNDTFLVIFSRKKINKIVKKSFPLTERPAPAIFDVSIWHMASEKSVSASKKLCQKWPFAGKKIPCTGQVKSLLLVQTASRSEDEEWGPGFFFRIWPKMVHFLEVWCTFLRGGAPEEKNQIRKGTKQTNQAFFLVQWPLVQLYH